MNITLPTRIVKLATLLIFLSVAAHAQQLKLGINPTVVKRSALLELESNSQGLLLTRIADTAVFAPVTNTPDDGTLIYLKADNSLRIRANGIWQKVSTGTTGTGNITLNGDVTGTGPGTVTTTIANQAVTFPKMQNIATQTLLGRYSAGTGGIQPITLDNSLRLTAAGILYADSARAIWNASRLQSRRILDSVPSDGDVLKWNPARALWLPAPDITGGASYGDLPTRDIRNADAPDPRYRMKIWAGPVANAGTVTFGPAGTAAFAWSVLAFQNGAYTTQLYFDKNTLAIKEWRRNAAPLEHNPGPPENPWYKMVTTLGDNIFTDGALIFAGKTSDASSEVKQDPNNLFWDDNNNELGIGTNNPAASLDVNGDFKLGTEGTVLTGIIRLLNVTVNGGGNFNNGNTNEVVVNLAGSLGTRTINVGANIIVNPRADLPNRIGIGWVKRESGTSIRIGFINTGTNNSVGTINFDITIIQ